MFQVLERDGQLMPVYSKADLEYMQRRGWKPHVQKVAALLKPEPAELPAPVDEEAPRQKRKYTRKAKA